LNDLRILELEINGFRGIRQLTLRPQGKNFLVLGPNGTGKSAVVDAVDYLVSGRISRLTGPGSGNLRLESHGPHLDFSPANASVKGVVIMEGIEQPVSIERTLSKRNPKVEPESAGPGLSLIAGLARQGQHLLTRREILRFIVAEAGNRAEMVQAVLSASDVEDVRKAILRCRTSLEREASTTLRSVTDATAQVNRLLGLDAFDETRALAVVNRLRQTLEWVPLASIGLALLDAGTSDRARLPPTIATGGAQILEELKRLLEMISGSGSAEARDAYRVLSDRLAAVRSDPELLRSLASRQLVETGLSLLGGTGECPLCGLPWDEERLRGHLEARLDRARAAEVIQQRITEAAESVRAALTPAYQILREAALSISGVENVELKTEMLSWSDRLTRLIDELISPLDKLDTTYYSEAQVAVFLAADRGHEVVSKTILVIEPSAKDVPPKQLALTTLAKVEEALQGVSKSEKRSANARRAHQDAVILYEEYERAQNDVFSGIYADVAGRFTQLYSDLHGTEEPFFRAQLNREGAGLDFQVDFAGRGFYPPQALHSEGHQDSMGLCLFLALSERIASGSVGFALLDDVVMSIDHEHRRAVARLLAACSKDRQFIITTHDRVWAEQLRIFGVVSDDSVFEIRNWSLGGGPVGGPRDPPWVRILQRLDEADVKQAASLLREYLEFYFSEVCASLRARVTYHADARWELQELLQEGAARYTRLLKKGAELATARSQPAVHEALLASGSTFSTLMAASRSEGWAINPTVHYTAWADLTPEDFQPIVDTFKGVCDELRCRRCGSLLTVIVQGAREVTVRCNCGGRQWDVSELGATVLPGAND
jgi:hypothetical protein